MNKYKVKYSKKCTCKVTTFYIKDEAILNFANSINFQAFVKDALTNALNDQVISGKPSVYAKGVKLWAMHANVIINYKALTAF